MAERYNFQKTRGCRHVKIVYTEMPHPKYGSKVSYFERSELEESCTGTCGGRN